MYFGNVILMIGTPLALGSYWGLLVVIVGFAVPAIRITDEESLLKQELAGYRDNGIAARRSKRRLISAAAGTIKARGKRFNSSAVGRTASLWDFGGHP